jgi:hypothetical protein
MNSATQRLDAGSSDILQAAGQQQGATADKNRSLDAMTAEAVQTGNAVYMYARCRIRLFRKQTHERMPFPSV